MNLKTSRGGRALPALVPSFLLLLLTAACGGGADAPASQQVLKFTAIPDKNTTELAAKYQVVADHLSKELGVPVEYVPTADYGASVELFKTGDVQLAWFGGLTSVQAVAKVPGARIIATGKVDPAFKSYFVAHNDAGIAPSDSFPMALEGKSFTFGPSNSTSGRLMPEHFIRVNTQRSPEEFFGAPNRYSSGHDQTAKLVEAGTFQAGALNYVTYDSMVRDGKLDPALCVKVWTTPPYADYNFTAHPMLDERYGKGFTDRLQQALVGIQDPAVLKAMQRPDGIIAAKNVDFLTVHELAVQLDLMLE
jgi:phosphonate transport system substrate-binding protein